MLPQDAVMPNLTAVAPRALRRRWSRQWARRRNAPGHAGRGRMIQYLCDRSEGCSSQMAGSARPSEGNSRGEWSND